MCCPKRTRDKYLGIAQVIFIFLISILHLVSYFFVKPTDFESILEVFESSPLFDFYIDKECRYSNVIFHVWEGRTEFGLESTRKGTVYTKLNYLDETEIDRINGYRFCYTPKKYMDLLYNNQIIKKEEQCSSKYPQDCGTIDTLEQHLCIKQEEKCPLYDVTLNEPSNKQDYNIAGDANNIFYYNNENYNIANKKIIGSLILNDGQPCYRLGEKLWKKFIIQEYTENHLECTLEIFGEKTDKRYENKGNVTYKSLYQILPEESKKLILDEIKGDEYVSLYKREFIGIDKKCDEKYDINRYNYQTLRSAQKMEKTCLLVESIIILCLFFLLVLSFIFNYFDKSPDYVFFVLLFLFICFFPVFICFICQSVFLGRMIKFDLSYDCSDKITNEVIRKENINTQRSIKFTAINLAFDILYLLVNGINIYLYKCYSESKEELPKEIAINNHKINDHMDKYNIENFKKESAREVIVNNKTPAIMNEFDKPVNNINNNMNNNPYPNFNNGFGVPQ